MICLSRRNDSFVATKFSGRRGGISKVSWRDLQRVPCGLFHKRLSSFWEVPRTIEALASCERGKGFCVFFCKRYALFGRAYFSHLSNQRKKTRWKRTPFCGCATQWFSSGKISSSAGRPLSLAALNALMPCPAKMR